MIPPLPEAGIWVFPRTALWYATRLLPVGIRDVLV
jgi:hypothetical protein